MKHVWFKKKEFKELIKIICWFSLPIWDLPNHNASYGIIEKPSIKKKGCTKVILLMFRLPMQDLEESLFIILYNHYLSKISELKNQVLKLNLKLIN